MSKMYVMIGLPGCGKSTYIATHKQPDDIVVSRDAIRYSMLKDGDAYFSKEKAVYNEFIRQINAAIETGKAVWVDQTSLNRGSRSKLFGHIATKPDTVVGIYMNIPLDTVLARNSLRTGRALVPEDAILNMCFHFEEPQECEGFDYIVEVKH